MVTFDVSQMSDRCGTRRGGLPSRGRSLIPSLQGFTRRNCSRTKSMAMWSGEFGRGWIRSMISAERSGVAVAQLMVGISDQARELTFWGV